MISKYLSKVSICQIGKKKYPKIRAICVLIILFILLGSVTVSALDVGFIGGKIIEIITSFIVKLFKLLLGDLTGPLDLIEGLLIMNPQIYPLSGGRKEMMRNILEILYPFMILAAILTGIYMVFTSITPANRARAKSALLKILMAMVLTAVSPIIYQILLDVDKAMTMGVINVYKDILATSHPPGTTLGSALEDAMVGSSLTTGISYFVLYYLVVFPLTWLAVDVLAFRYIMVGLLGFLFPAIIFLYMFELTKNVGRKLLKATLGWVFSPVLAATWLAILVAILPSITSGTSPLFGLFFAITCLALMVIHPLIVSGLLSTLGSITTTIGEMMPSGTGVGLVALGGMMQGQGPSALVAAGMKAGYDALKLGTARDMLKMTVGVTSPTDVAGGGVGGAAGFEQGGSGPMGGSGGGGGGGDAAGGAARGASQAAGAGGDAAAAAADIGSSAAQDAAKFAQKGAKPGVAVTKAGVKLAAAGAAVYGVGAIPGIAVAAVGVGLTVAGGAAGAGVGAAVGAAKGMVKAAPKLGRAALKAVKSLGTSIISSAKAGIGIGAKFGAIGKAVGASVGFVGGVAGAGGRILGGAIRTPRAIARFGLNIGRGFERKMFSRMGAGLRALGYREAGRFVREIGSKGLFRTISGGIGKSLDSLKVKYPLLGVGLDIGKKIGGALRRGLTLKNIALTVATGGLYGYYKLLGAGLKLGGKALVGKGIGRSLYRLAHKYPGLRPAIRKGLSAYSPIRGRAKRYTRTGREYVGKGLSFAGPYLEAGKKVLRFGAKTYATGGMNIPYMLAKYGAGRARGAIGRRMGRPSARVSTGDRRGGGAPGTVRTGTTQKEGSAEWMQKFKDAIHDTIGRRRPEEGDYLWLADEADQQSQRGE